MKKTSLKPNYWQKFVLRLTHRLWNFHISRILCRAYSQRVITSALLHTLTAKFDPGGKHDIYSLTTFYPGLYTPRMPSTPPAARNPS